MKVDIHTIQENPHNPRSITEDKFVKLVKSLEQFPEMLEARPIVVDENNVVLGGNMRLKAAKEAGLKEVPIFRSEWSHDKNSEFIIKDNVGFGEWDWDLLANEWDMYELEEWGLNFPHPEPMELDTVDVEQMDVLDPATTIKMALTVPKSILDDVQRLVDQIIETHPTVRCRIED